MSATKRRKSLAVLAISLAVAGCANDHTAPQLNEQAAQNEWMISSYQDDMVRAGVVAQATLGEHHFVAGTAELNDLGVRDSGYLADRLARAPGPVNLRRGEADDALYTARVNAVRLALTGAGVPASRITISDGWPGGEGLRAPRAGRVLEQDVEPLESVTSTGSALKGASTAR